MSCIEGRRQPRPRRRGRARARSSGPMGARMKLVSFSRYPFLFGPSPVHPLERLRRAPGRRPGVGEAR